MSKTVVVTIETVETQFPAGTVAAGINFTLSGGVVPAQLVTAAPFTVSFADVADGSYTVTAQAVDAAGTAIGAAAVSAEFVIASDVSIAIPSVVTVSIQ
jgi:hypothetical protein